MLHKRRKMNRKMAGRRRRPYLQSERRIATSKSRHSAGRRGRLFGYAFCCLYNVLSNSASNRNY
ncbi:hypothetical protein CHCC14821_1325 [Bacillus paralicheniformis]|nr:hypothetical protein CHCC14821_1325 [Bacillus paralicheniformis]